MSRRQQLAVLYILVAVLVVLIVFTFSLQFVDDGLPLNTSGFRYPIA